MGCDGRAASTAETGCGDDEGRNTASSSTYARISGQGLDRLGIGRPMRAHGRVRTNRGGRSQATDGYDAAHPRPSERGAINALCRAGVVQATVPVLLLFFVDRHRDGNFERPPMPRRLY